MMNDDIVNPRSAYTRWIFCNHVCIFAIPSSLMKTDKKENES